MNTQGIPNPSAQLTYSWMYTTTKIARPIPAHILRYHQLKKELLSLFSCGCFSSNWSAPKAWTQGLWPLCPMATIYREKKNSALRKEEGEEVTSVMLGIRNADKVRNASPWHQNSNSAQVNFYFSIRFNRIHFFYVRKTKSKTKPKPYQTIHYILDRKEKRQNETNQYVDKRSNDNCSVSTEKSVGDESSKKRENSTNSRPSVDISSGDHGGLTKWSSQVAYQVRSDPIVCEPLRHLHTCKKCPQRFKKDEIVKQSSSWLELTDYEPCSSPSTGIGSSGDESTVVNGVHHVFFFSRSRHLERDYKQEI